MSGHFNVQQLQIPSELESRDAADFLAAIDIDRQAMLRQWGNDDLAYTPQEVLASAQDRYERHRHLIVKDAGEVLGHCQLIMPVEDNQHLLWLSLAVKSSAEGRGIGQKLLAAAEELARAEGRRTITFQTSHPVQSVRGELVEPVSGIGRLPRESREVQFAQRAGYVLEQVERFSLCQLPLASELLIEQAAIAQAAAGENYRLVQWTDHCPEQWLDDFAWLQSRMSTDAPRAGLVREEEPWDAHRAREGEALALALGRTTLVAAVEHLPSGKLVGFTVLTVPAHRQDMIFQDNTLVVREHRGHKLGLLVKVANLIRLTEERPAVRRIYTWNAAENEYMLAVNVALGFRPAGYTGEWQKVLG